MKAEAITLGEASAVEDAASRVLGQIMARREREMVERIVDTAKRVEGAGDGGA